MAWLLNIRGYDNPNSPIANARLILNKKKELFLIANENNLKADVVEIAVVNTKEGFHNLDIKTINEAVKKIK